MTVRKRMPIPATTQLVADCYAAAETSSREQLQSDYLDKGEVFITDLFHGRLRAAVREANDRKKIERAFLEDLKRSFPTLRGSDVLERLATGIRVRTTLHGEAERKTGGDLGIVFIRPDVSASAGGPPVLKVDRDYRRGLLCQAKIRRRASVGGPEHWGTFTENQRKLLPSHLDYLALLLYEYETPARDTLKPFRWQLCKGATMKDMEEWLSSDTFPEPASTSATIAKLGSDRIGTDDKAIITRHIGPEVRPALIVEIGWPPGGGPGAFVTLPVSQPQRQQIRAGH